MTNEDEFTKEDFINIHKQTMLVNGMYENIYKSVLIKLIEGRYKKAVVVNFYISELITKGDDFLICWKERYRPLTDEEYETQYGKR